jgi:hypothetical protein
MENMENAWLGELPINGKHGKHVVREVTYKWKTRG